MRLSAAICIIVIAAVCIRPIMPAVAAAEDQAPQAEALDGAIEEVLQKRLYQWRMPRTERPVEEEPTAGPIGSFFDWLGQGLSAALKTTGDLLGRLVEWIESLAPETPRRQEGESGDWMTPVRILLTALLVLLAVGFIYGLWRFLTKRPLRQAEAAATTPSTALDLADEEISAAELPADRWLDLARQLTGKGDLRLAMKAFYLATLARLADQQLLAIEFYKSNLDYKHELDRRAGAKNDLRAAFDHSIRAFERTWYGLKTVTRSELDDFVALQEKIIGSAQG
jgi:hypothetical protein